MTEEVVKSSKEILTELFDSFDAEPPSSPSVTVELSPNRPEPLEKKNSDKAVKKRKKEKKSKSRDDSSKRSPKKKKKKKKHKSKSKRADSESEASESRKTKSKSKKSKKRSHSVSSDKSEVNSKRKKKSSCKSITAMDVLKAELDTECTTLLEKEQISNGLCKNIIESETTILNGPESIPLPDEPPKKSIVPENIQPTLEELKDGNNDKKSNGALPLKVADVFVEDLLAEGEKSIVESLSAPLEKHKMSIKITDLKNSSVFEAAEAQAKLKAEKYEEGEISDSSRQSSSHSLSDITNKDTVTTQVTEKPEPITEFLSTNEKEKKKRHKHHKHRKSDKSERRSLSSEKEEKKTSKSSHSKEKSRRTSRERERSKEKRLRRSRSTERSKVRSRSRDRKHKESVDRKKKSEKSTGTRRSKSPHRQSRSRKRSSSRRRSTSRKRSRSHSRKRSRSHSRKRSSSRKRSTSRKRSNSRKRSRSRKRSTSSKRSNSRKRSRSRSRLELSIDKNKLLEIARKNALSMIKQGTVGSDINKMAAITAGGKTVDELTDFCKLLSQKDATGQESISSGSCNSSDTESEKPFHHPFLLKDRPNSIVMNIRNCAALPVKTHQEKTAEHAQQLRLQFPVSSGQQHRKTENEWVPVSPKPDLTKQVVPIAKSFEPPVEETRPMFSSNSSTQDLLMVQEMGFPLPPLPPDPPSVFHNHQASLDIGEIVTQRLTAMRKLQEDPHDSDATEELRDIQNKMKLWAESKNQPGLFTGSTGARVLSQAELASGQQAWAKKDQLMCAQPVSGGMGMSLLQKMGWKPGEGLGKHNEGTLEPLKLPVKMDKRGLVCAEELPRRQQVQTRRAGPVAKPNPSKNLEGKHPVSLLVEFCTKRHFGPPVFSVCFEDGPSHKKSFIFKVTVNGIDYKATTPSPNKKLAKSEAASVCLRALGVLPTV